MVRGFFVALSLTLLLTSCGKDGTSSTQNEWLKNAKPGWSEQAVRDYIACEPVESKVCQCIIGKITPKYTPTQVHEKSPLVAADMIGAYHSCAESKQPISTPVPPHTKPKPGQPRA